MASTSGPSPRLQQQIAADQTPSEMVDETIYWVERGFRKIVKHPHPKYAKRAFTRARRRLIGMAGPIHQHYGLHEDEIEDFMGSNIEDLNEDLAELVAEMSGNEIVYLERGDFDVDRETLMKIQDVIVDLESLSDLLNGIEEGEIVINE